MLREFAFGPIQKTIEARRDRIREAVEEADNARNEARELLEQNRAILAEARSESAQILAEARKVADAQIQRAKDEAEAERLRRLEDTRKQVEAETSRAIDQIRVEVADLTIEATQRVVGKVLDSADQRRLIDEAIEGLDFSALERGEASAMAVAERLYATRPLRGRRGQGRVEAVHRDLDEFADAVTASPELAAFLANPQVETAAKISNSRRALRRGRRARPQLPARDRCEGARGPGSRHPERVPGARRPRAGARRGGADDRRRAVRRRGHLDRRQIRHASGHTVEATRKSTPSWSAA